ncbi:hypothetical protein KAW18_01915 [candidate division WOR-3 bacterium]|nr:hypothetical protein [candidate division WOR-3 bacterium]
MVRIVEVENVTYSDYGGRLSKTEIEKEVKRYAADKYEPRKALVVYRDRHGGTLIIWKRLVKKGR